MSEDPEIKGSAGDQGGSSDRGERNLRPAGDRPSRGSWSVKAKLRARERKKARKAKKGMFQRRKVCRYCADKKLVLSYKDPKTAEIAAVTGHGITRSQRILDTYVRTGEDIARHEQ